MATRLPTGIGVLDQRLDGGIPPGSIVALCAPPASQVDLLLSAFMEPRETLYLALDRTEFGVSDALQRAPDATGDPSVRSVADGDRVDRATDLLEDLPERSTLVVDPHSVIEREDPTRLSEFMTRLRRRIVDTESLAILHCLDGRSVPERRDTTVHIADVVLRLTTTAVGTTVENRLAIPKFRGGRPPTDVLKLRLTDRVEVDTSRDIA